MPTLNKSYNNCLIKWAKSGHESKPECEECETDLTGEEVYETLYGWYCKGCADDYIDEHGSLESENGPSDYSERMEERRQMGLCDF